MDDYARRLFFGERPPDFPPERLVQDTDLLYDRVQQPEPFYYGF